jgi:hypothetical protein
MKRIANIILFLLLLYHIKMITKITFNSPPTDSKRQFTRILRLGLLLMNLKGLKILNILTILINPKFYPARLISIIENMTITKSI